ncbi:NAC domain-containing protein 26-like [Actinidia eriantha]|uniref:NAC domain-containing protein 26-like n=1 Tax=Actinidia eriantha TaxID=165200 RepID=UPI00258D9F5B|nr:NAC domain-containing protein 26-like [Actinidia eriantha]
MAKRLREGLKFRPTDQELINDYLFNKIIGKELPFEGIILERDVYDQHVLSEIFRSWVKDKNGDVSEDTQSYFFTRLKKKTANGETYCRKVGNGTWRSQYSRVINADEYDNESIPIGIKRSLEYIDSGSVQHKNWIIMEFSLAGVSLEHPLSSKDYVICRLQKSRGGKHGDQATPSGCFNNKRIKLPSKQNQQMENQQTESAPLVDEQVGLIKGEAGVQTLEQIMQYLLEPDSSMVDGERVVATVTLATPLPSSGHYDVLDSTLPFDSMPPLMEAKPAPTVDEDGGYPSGENEVRMQPSVPDQSLPSSNPEHAVLDYIHSLASAPEATAIENDVGILEQPSILPPKSLPADSPGHAISNSIIPSAMPTSTVEPSYEMGDNKSWVESFSEDLLSMQHDLPWEEREEESELLVFSNPTYDWRFG